MTAGPQTLAEENEEEKGEEERKAEERDGWRWKGRRRIGIMRKVRKTFGSSVPSSKCSRRGRRKEQEQKEETSRRAQ
eukprot:5122484-Pyramimonas_sp.AAC.1